MVSCFPSCTLTLKIFLSAAILYLLISVSLMIPSFKDYSSFHQEIVALQDRSTNEYECSRICDPLYQYQKDNVQCCNDILLTSCFTKTQCKDSKIANLEDAQKSALFDIEVGAGATLFFLIILIFIFRRKYQYFLNRELAFRQGIDDTLTAEQGITINDSLLEKTRSGIVYKSFEDNTISQEYCVICYQQFAKEKLVKLGCSHQFHAECIREWLDKKSDCPMCRADA